MLGLIKGFLPLPPLKTSLVSILVVIATLSCFLGWRWISDIRSSLKTHEETITSMNKTLGAKDKEIEVLDIARRAADAKAENYAADTERLNQETKVNAHNAQKYKLQSDHLRKQLTELQLDTQCARAPVPDDVVRMQQQSITEFNAKYSR